MSRHDSTLRAHPPLFTCRSEGAAELVLWKGLSEHRIHGNKLPLLEVSRKEGLPYLASDAIHPRAQSTRQ